jgi:drug/metabolite transporter (DMT)-like permease
MTIARDNGVGAAFLAGGMSLFMISDTFAKLLMERIPTGQVVCARNLLTTALVLVLWLVRPRLIRPADLLDRFVLLRSFFDTVTTLLYLYGIAVLPLADGVAVLFSSPLISVGLAAILLGERVGRARWLAVALGFAGVLLVVQPGGSSFRWAILLPVAGAFTLAMGDIVTRRIRPDIASTTVVLSNVASVALAGGVAALIEGHPLALSRPLGFVGAAGFLLLGYLGYVLAFRRGEVSFIAPFKYAGLPAAMLLGWIAWGQVPSPLVLLGAATIVAAGLVTLWAERHGSVIR